MSAELSPDDLRRLDTLFERAVDLPAEQHRAFIERECGANTALARELERLLEGDRGEDHELTRPQWWRATRSLPTAAGAPDHRISNLMPADQMTWVDADRAMRRLGLELPQEEQWEYAARATTQTVWYTGGEEISLQGHANLFDKTGAAARPGWVQETGPGSIIADGAPGMTLVGSHEPNPFGLHDVHGNVYEWCANAPYPYRPGEGRADAATLSTERIARGGSSRNNAMFARCSARFAADTSFALPALGIRPARAIDP